LSEVEIMGEQLLIQNYVAGGALAGNRFVKADSTEGQVVAAGDGDAPFGITDRVGSPPTITEAVGAVEGDRVDVVQVGVTDLELGGTVAFGEYIEPGTDGVGVAYSGGAPGALALESGEEGDIIRVLVLLGAAAGLGS
jgi:hypothetical protein